MKQIVTSTNASAPLEPAARDPRFDNSDLYERYEITLQIRHFIVGGIPRNPEVLHAWIKAKTGHNDALTLKQVEALAPAMAAQKAPAQSTDPVDIIAEQTDASWNGFAADDQGLYIEARQIKAMIRESMTMLRINSQKIGSKQVFQHGMEVRGKHHELRVHLGMAEPTGSLEGPIHIVGPQGPRTALKRVDYADRPRLTFEIWVFKTDPKERRHLGEDDIIEIFKFAQDNGLGAERSQGRGKFDVVAFKKIN